MTGHWTALVEERVVREAPAVTTTSEGIGSASSHPAGFVSWIDATPARPPAGVETNRR
jgi:hypothetical protein